MSDPRFAFDGERAYEHVRHLVVDIGERRMGQAGEHAAARYIAKVFRAAGLKTRYQKFPCLTFRNSRCELSVRHGRRWRTVESLPVMRASSTPPGGVEGEVYFAEGGGPEHLSPAMKDKIVFCCGTLTGESRRRVLRYGARAVVFIDTALRDEPRRSTLSDHSRRDYGNLPMASIRHLDGVELFRDRPGRARLVLRNHDVASESLNVIGEVAGTDFPDEIIVVCGHYDSVWGTPGACDNAGGTGIVMELARVLAARPTRRTLRFIAFAAEETGLHGSTFYANDLAARHRRAVKKASFNEHVATTEQLQHRFTFNIDVHGPRLGRYKAMFNGPDDIGAAARLLAGELGKTIPVTKAPMSSDGTPLAAIGIPNLQIGRYGGYGHRSTDDIRWISADALADAGQFAEAFLRRYVTDIGVFPFERDIPDDQMKDIRNYFTRGREGRPIPGEEPARPARPHRGTTPARTPRRAKPRDDAGASA